MCLVQCRNPCPPARKSGHLTQLRGLVETGSLVEGHVKTAGSDDK